MAAPFGAAILRTGSYTRGAMKWGELAEFVESGVAMLGASADADGVSEAFRVWGAAVVGDATLRALVNADAFQWLRRAMAGHDRYDAVIVDMPDPDSTATAKLYSTEFYALARRALAPGGRLVQPFEIAAETPYSFYLVVPEASLHNRSVAAFRDWLLDESAPERVKEPA